MNNGKKWWIKLHQNQKFFSPPMQRGASYNSLSWPCLSVVCHIWYSGQTDWARITKLGRWNDLDHKSSLTGNDVTIYFRSAVVRQNASVGFNSARSRSVLLLMLLLISTSITFHRVSLFPIFNRELYEVNSSLMLRCMRARVRVHHMYVCVCLCMSRIGPLK